MAKVETYVQPRRLYRYRSLAQIQQELDAIENAYLYCSPYRNLNDPMEGLFTSSRLFRKSAEYRTLRNAIRDNKAQIGICSFSEVYDHELMWAHYANQFTGICVAYSFSRLLKALDREISLFACTTTKPVRRCTGPGEDRTNLPGWCFRTRTIAGYTNVNGECSQAKGRSPITIMDV